MAPFSVIGHRQNIMVDGYVYQAKEENGKVYIKEDGTYRHVHLHLLPGYTNQWTEFSLTLNQEG